ncbi:PH-like domain-containing protein [Dioscorea alata]|uniref:PH-like domain-containing protein n=1 Tax=Dioscorea alata TaxID=55571 RepID=A0ACB7TZU7_DIOAL|nr:PH-like domain-containing protein [Dioscorea alata]
MSSPWSSSLSPQFLSLVADQLNVIAHVRFRSVCSHWRKSTNPRPKDPLIILCDTDLDQSQEEKPIKALSFFDMVSKDIIPFPETISEDISSEDISNSHFLGASHGYIALGCYDPQLKILLMNPFTGYVNKLPRFLDQDVAAGGRILLSDSPMAPQLNPTVVYHTTNSSRVFFMRIHDNRWHRLILPGAPEDIITSGGIFYVNYGPQLFVLNFNAIYSIPSGPVPQKYPCLFPNWVSPNLKFLVNSSNKLFVTCTMSFQRKDFQFLALEFNRPDLVPAYVGHLGQYCYPLLVPENHCPFHIVTVLAYHHYALFSWLSKFWSDVVHRWEPVGWIFPDLNMP